MSDPNIDDTNVGKGTYVVRAGESIASIAHKFGLFADTVWDHPDNADLKSARGNPDLLLAGDRVTIPEKRLQEESGAAGARHRFRRKGIPRTLRVRLVDCDESPLSNANVTVAVDGAAPASVVADGDGWLEHGIEPNAKIAIVRLEDGSEFELKLGSLSPVNTTLGVQQRLHNLGYFNGRLDGKPSEKLRDALIDFQAARELEPTGEADGPTLDELEKLTSC